MPSRISKMILVVVTLIAGLSTLLVVSLARTKAPSAERQRTEVEATTLFPTGFEPRAITRPQGKFILAVDNRSLNQQVDLQLIKVNGNRISGKIMRMRELRWRQLIDLPPGNYVVTEANNPQWRFDITITPR
jgi:hypothetical protein